MTATQAAQRPATQAKENGIRPFDIARDLRPVAELIADAFASELDERGEAALREMRVMSRLGGVLGVLNRTTSDLQNFFGGFVWVVGGKLIGGGNMVALHLAKAAGGNLLLGFLSAVAFATILAVVAGLAFWRPTLAVWLKN